MGIVIAIDGPAGAGKSTVARGLAGKLGATCLDSGAMYRCVALAALRAGADLDDGGELGRIAAGLEISFAGEAVLLDGERVTAQIRTPEVSAAASRVSVYPEVRAAMVARQRALVGAGDWIVEGRDIGTVVAPDADLKVFLTATPAERARRRAADSGEDVAAVAAAHAERDRRDSGRAHGALRAAGDAIELDTTGQPASRVVERIVEIASRRGVLA